MDYSSSHRIIYWCSSDVIIEKIENMIKCQKEIKLDSKLVHDRMMRISTKNIYGHTMKSTGI